MRTTAAVWRAVHARLNLDRARVHLGYVTHVSDLDPARGVLDISPCVAFMGGWHNEVDRLSQ